MTRLQPRLLPLVALASVALVAVGGPVLLRLGFYHDDWATLSFLHFSAPGLPARMASLARGTPALWFRPLDMPILAALYGLFGLRPLPWQLALFSANVFLAEAVYRLLRRYETPPRAALLGAALFLVYPNKDATMFWTALILNSLALLCFLRAVLCQLDYVETGRRSSLALAAALLLASLATYDQCFFLPCLWAVTPGLSRDGVPRRARVSLAAAAGVVAAFAFYKFWLVSHVLGFAYNKTILLSPAHFLAVYRDGLGTALGGGVILSVLRAAWSELRSSPALSAAALALPWLIGTALGADDAPAAAPRRTELLILGAGVFLLGYLPIAVSDYFPTAFNHMNRINQVPVLGLILGATALFRRPRDLALGGGLASILLLAHAASAGAWAESFRRQQDIKALIQAHAADWPAGTTLVLALPEPFVSGKAPLLLEYWDLSGAAQIWTEDASRRADVVNERTDFRPEGIVLRPGRAPLPYDAVVFAAVERGVFAKVSYQNFRRVPLAGR